MNDSHDKSNNGNDNNSNENAQKCAILEQLNCKERGGLGFVFDPVVPGKGVPPELMLVYVGDCRWDWGDGQIHAQNVEFVAGQEQGWPCVHFVTTQKIPKGELLWTKYPKQYCIDFESKIDFKKACQINEAFFGENKKQS